MLFKKNDLNAEYTKIISNYLSEGYIIRPKDMASVHTDEICHIDFMKQNNPRKVIRVWMVNSCKLPKIEKEISSTINTKIISLIVKEYDVTPNISKSLWLKDGTTISESNFFEITEGIYESDYTKFVEISNLRLQRSIARYSSCNEFKKRKLFNVDKLPKSFVKSIVERIRKNYGCKRATADSIIRVELIKDYDSKLLANVNWTFKTHNGCIVLV